MPTFEAARDPSNIYQSREFDPKFAPFAHAQRRAFAEVLAHEGAAVPSIFAPTATFGASAGSTLPFSVATKGSHTSPSTPSRAWLRRPLRTTVTRR